MDPWLSEGLRVSSIKPACVRRNLGQEKANLYTLSNQTKIQRISNSFELTLSKICISPGMTVKFIPGGAESHSQFAPSDK